MAFTPYDAVKLLQRCAKDNSTAFPRAAQVVVDEFYVDGMLTSVKPIDEVESLRP